MQSVCAIGVALFSRGKIALMGSVAELGREVLGGRLCRRYRGRRRRIGRTARAHSGGSGGRREDRASASFACMPTATSRPEAAVEVGGDARPAQIPSGVQEPSLEAIYNRYFDSKPEDVVQEGAPRCSVKARLFSGLGVVMLKELSDHLTSVRMRVLEWAGPCWWRSPRSTAPSSRSRTPPPKIRSCSCGLFTTSREPLPSFVALPVVSGAADGRSDSASIPLTANITRRTLSRILSQPIYRDALLFGKFLAGPGDALDQPAHAVGCWSVGLGLLLIGIPPGAEEIARSFVFLLVTIVYAGVWLALALLLFSILFRSAATAALITLGLWLLVTFILAGAGRRVCPKSWCRRIRAYMALGLQTPGDCGARANPGPAFAIDDALCRGRRWALLDPTTRALGADLPEPASGRPCSARRLPLGEEHPDCPGRRWSGMVASAIMLFVIGYVIFQRQEVRA